MEQVIKRQIEDVGRQLGSEILCMSVHTDSAEVWKRRLEAVTILSEALEVLTAALRNLSAEADA